MWLVWEILYEVYAKYTGKLVHDTGMVNDNVEVYI